MRRAAAGRLCRARARRGGAGGARRRAADAGARPGRARRLARGRPLAALAAPLPGLGLAALLASRLRRQLRGARLRAAALRTHAGSEARLAAAWPHLWPLWLTTLPLAPLGRARPRPAGRLRSTRPRRRALAAARAPRAAPAGARVRARAQQQRSREGRGLPRLPPGRRPPAARAPRPRLPAALPARPPPARRRARRARARPRPCCASSTRSPARATGDSSSSTARRTGRRRRASSALAAAAGRSSLALPRRGLRRLARRRRPRSPAGCSSSSTSPIRGGGAYYRDLAVNAVRLACGGPAGPPRSSRELLRRLRPEALVELHPTGSLEALEAAAFGRGELDGIRARYAAFFATVGAALDGARRLRRDSTAPTSCSTACGSSRRPATSPASWSRSSPSGRSGASRAQQRVLLVVDEFSALAAAGRGLVDVVERTRAFGVAAVLCPQLAEGMGSAEASARLIGSAQTILLHAMATPERFVEAAGGRRVAETTLPARGRAADRALARSAPGGSRASTPTRSGGCGPASASRSAPAGR